MKIFVTGGLGFIGSNFIIRQIDKYKNQIFNYDKITYAANNENLSKYSDNALYYFLKGDINDKSKLIDQFNYYEPDYIINFAAESHVDRSIDGPGAFINTNIVGTFALLQASLEYYKNISGHKKNNFKFIHVSTDEVYGSLGKKGYLERLLHIIHHLHIQHQKHLQIIWFEHGIILIKCHVLLLIVQIIMDHINFRKIGTFNDN